MVDFGMHVRATDIDPSTGQPIPKTSFGFSSVQTPTEIQSRYCKTIQTQVAVPLTITGGATPTNTSAMFSTDGFDTISVIATSSASHNGRFQIIWSFDGVTANAYEIPSGATGTVQYRFSTVPVRAPYARIYFENQDGAVAPTINAWAYLKA